MSDLPALPAAVPSPCIKLCRMDEQRRYCQGCWRTIEEITLWSKLDDPARLQILQALPQRSAEAGVAAALATEAPGADPSGD